MDSPPAYTPKRESKRFSFGTPWRKAQPIVREIHWPDVIDQEKGRPAFFRAGASQTSLGSLDAPITVSWSKGEPDDPHNFSKGWKIYIVFVGIVLVFNSTFGSAVAAGSAEPTGEYFGITSKLQLVLPTSIYIVGYVLGPLLTAPLSEAYGRLPITLIAFVLYTVGCLGSALAPTWAGLNIFRLIGGIGAGTPISVTGGIFADIYTTPKARGMAIMLLQTITVLGPVVGPAASGFISVVSWRWAYWLQLMLAGISWPFALTLPETFSPILLRRKASNMRRTIGDPSYLAPAETSKSGMKELFTQTLATPFRMFFLEAIVLSSCLYMAMVYAVFYMFLEAYPIIFQTVYGFNAGEEGLTFLAIGVGAIMACGVYLFWNSYLAKQLAKKPPPAWTQQEEYRRVPLACVGGPFLVVGLFWLGWAARPDVHWIVPTLAGVPFGLAFLMIFMSLINYIVDAYEAFSASALAASSCSRSLFGVVLPFAVPSMFSTLGIAWACSLLAFVSLAMAAIPFVFLRYGDKIRANSKFCQELKRQKEAN